MKLFLDTNVMLDLLGNRNPFFEDAAKVVSLADKGKATLAVSALSFATTDYFLSKILSPARSKEGLIKFKAVSEIVSLDENIIDKSLSSNFSDFEDGLQYYSAIKSDCNYIITRNTKDFKSAEIPVMTPQEFLTSLSQQP